MADTIKNTIARIWGELLGVLDTAGIADIIDILVVALLVYYAIRLVRETRAMQLVKGIAAIVLLYLIATGLHMVTLGVIMRSVLGLGITAVVVLFQPEIRRALEQMGRTKFGQLGALQADQGPEGVRRLIECICAVCTGFSRDKVGALIVIERDTKLGDVIKTGTLVDAVPSVELFGNLFFNNSPLHDGAAVIRQGRLLAAGCYLPLSQNMDIGRELGTRHRAGLGMSEVSDAIVVIVSEETGAITVAYESRLQRNLSPQNLSRLLGAKLIVSDEDKPASKIPFADKLVSWRKKNEK